MSGDKSVALVILPVVSAVDKAFVVASTVVSTSVVLAIVVSVHSAYINTPTSDLG